MQWQRDVFAARGKGPWCRPSNRQQPSSVYWINQKININLRQHVAMQTPIFQIFAPQMPPPAKCPPPSSPCRAPRTAMALRVNSSALVRTYVGLGPACFGLDFKCFCKNRIRVCHCHLESPLQEPDYQNRGGVQRFFCKRLQGLWSHPYRSRLAQLGLDSLYRRRVKADLLVCYKILHNRVQLNCDEFFALVRSSYYRQHNETLMTHVYSARYSNFFSNCVINIWNALPDSIVKSPSVSSFKSKINSLHFCDFCADCAV